jgi:hypothetical protein
MRELSVEAADTDVSLIQVVIDDKSDLREIISCRSARFRNGFLSRRADLVYQRNASPP